MRLVLDEGFDGAEQRAVELMRQAGIEALHDAPPVHSPEPSIVPARHPSVARPSPRIAPRVGQGLAEGGDLRLQVLAANADALPGDAVARDRPDEDLSCPLADRRPGPRRDRAASGSRGWSAAWDWRGRRTRGIPSPAARRWRRCGPRRRCAAGAALPRPRRRAAAAAWKGRRSGPCRAPATGGPGPAARARHRRARHRRHRTVPPSAPAPPPPPSGRRAGRRIAPHLPSVSLSPGCRLAAAKADHTSLGKTPMRSASASPAWIAAGCAWSMRLARTAPARRLKVSASA